MSIRRFYSRPVWFSLLLFCSCDRVPLQTDIHPEASGCQGCHRSPPPTGAHEYHLFKQTHGPQITCQDCHGAAISRMIWTPSVDRRAVKQLLPWDSVEVKLPYITMIMPEVDTASYSLCLTQLRGDTLFSASLDFEDPQTVVEPKDSIYSDGATLQWFPYDSSYFRLDTISGITVLREVRVYRQPLSYDCCRYQLKNDTIFEVRLLAFDNAVRAVAAGDSMVEREEYNRRFILSPSPDMRDTIKGALIPPESTFLSRLSPEEMPLYTTEIKGGEYVVLVYDTTKFQIDTAVRIFIDTVLYQISADTLYFLKKDSTVHFGDNIYAENTSLHLDGKVDIFFIQEPATLYREDTIGAVIDSISGDTLDYEIAAGGAWVPGRASCWSFGLNPTNCHDNVKVERFWYNPKDTIEGNRL